MHERSEVCLIKTVNPPPRSARTALAPRPLFVSIIREMATFVLQFVTLGVRVRDAMRKEYET
jgi:hypothetical protein